MGCRQDMQDQPKYIPLRSSEFFEDGRSSRMPVEGTVARGQLKEDSYFYTGKIGNVEGDKMPFPVTEAVLRRGQERFNIYCTPCHSRLGDGNGMIVQRGYKHAGNFHEDKLLKAPIGHFFDVMSKGFGAMPDYASQLSPQDRWNIAAYIRALQLADNATLEDVPADQRSAIGTLAEIKAQAELKAKEGTSTEAEPAASQSAPGGEQGAPKH